MLAIEPPGEASERPDAATTRSFERYFECSVV
jgi:hypothetical protein